MDQRKKRQIVIISLLVVLITICLFFLFSGEEKAPTIIKEKPDSTALKIAVLPVIECLPLYVADQYGIADSTGLNLKVIPFESSMDIDTAFINHTVDGAVSDMVKLTKWQSRGDSITAIMSGKLDLSLVTSRQSRISNIKGLKEKIVGITRESIVDLYADKIVASSSKDTIELNKPQINNLFVRSRMVEQNQYDGAILPEPYASICVAHGGRRISNIKEINDIDDRFVVVFHDSILNIRKNDIEKLKKAYNMSVDYINVQKIFRKKQFYSMLGFTDAIPDSVFKIPKFNHYESLNNEK